MLHASGFDPALWAEVLRTYRQIPPGDVARRWLWLEVAHVVGQEKPIPHVKVHVWMLALAWQERRGAEMGGQLMRLLLVPFGHALGRLPVGNPGTSRVSAFRAMANTPEMDAVLAACRQALALQNVKGASV